MNRLLSTMKLDLTMQWRNRFYYVSFGLALLMGFGLVRLADHNALAMALPLLFLFIVGGTTTIYTAGLVIFEKDQQTIDAMLASPLRLSEYLISKVLTLTLLAVMEGLLMMVLSYGLAGVAFGPLLAGLVMIGAMMALAGFILIVRYRTITDVLMPLVLVAFIAQLPALYFTGISMHPLWLLIPTAAPTMLMWGGWHALEPWRATTPG